jgi:hypothetical protein
MDEIWIDVEGYEGLYQVSNKSRVRSFVKNKEGVVLKQTKEGCGYLQIQFNKNGKMKHNKVHRMVAKAFVPNPGNKPFVNHINGIKTDNRIENLEWVTGSENIKHAHREGLKIPTQLGKSGKLHHRSKPVISINQTAVIEHESASLCAKYLGVHSSRINLALKKGFNCMGHKIYYACV